MRFFYTAKKNDGLVQTGSLDASTETDARSQLVKHGFVPVKINRVKRPRFNLFKWQLGVPLVQKLFFTQNLEVMIRSGFSLGLALKTIVLQLTNKRMRDVVETVNADV